MSKHNEVYITIINNFAFTKKGNELTPIHFNGEKDDYDPIIVRYVKESLRKMILIGEQWYFTNETNDILVPFNVDSEKVCEQFGICEMQRRALLSYGKPEAMQLVPTELQDHYCLLFRGEVIYSFPKDKYEEFVKTRDSSTLAFTEYRPKI